MFFRPTVDTAWEYAINNWDRFIDKEKRAGKSLYDCSYVLFSGNLVRISLRQEEIPSPILAGGKSPGGISQRASID